MNDDRRKRLTGFLGECDHEFEFWNPGVGNICLHCKQWFYWTDTDQKKLIKRTFTTAQDMVDLAKKLVEMQKQLQFMCFADLSGRGTVTDPTEWLFTNPARFCDLVGEFLEGEK